MKYLRLFELTTEPKFNGGEYVIGKVHPPASSVGFELNDFFTIHIGKIEGSYNQDVQDIWKVVYDEMIPEGNGCGGRDFWYFGDDEIEIYSLNREDLENYLISRKYNL